MPCFDESPHPFDIKTCARPNILALQPYKCARDNYDADGSIILLDANENQHASTMTDQFDRHSDLLKDLNIYPCPRNISLKAQFCQFRNTFTHTNQKLTPANIFLGLGSDEAVDTLMRAFCRPGQDKILVCPPTYGMYAVSAQVNDLALVQVPLDVDNGFALRTDAINTHLSTDPNIKIVYLCSPGNPTGKMIPKTAIQSILRHQTWNGILVVDEAYIDFCAPDSSIAECVNDYPNLVVLQTMSKSFGLAGIRLGAAFTSVPIASILNNIRAPYNISALTARLASAALSKQGIAQMAQHRTLIEAQRNRMLAAIPRIPGIGRQIGGLDANFIMFETLDGPSGGEPCNQTAEAVYERLASTHGIVIRYRGMEPGCKGCIRISVGTEAQTTLLLAGLRDVLAAIYAERGLVCTTSPGGATGECRTAAISAGATLETCGLQDEPSRVVDVGSQLHCVGTIAAQ